MRSFVLRVIFSLGLVALLALPAASVSAQSVPGPTLVVENPNPGDMLPLGKLDMQGVAFDPMATSGTGVDRVSVFLDNRDEGGIFLGDAELGLPSTMSIQPEFGDAGWTLITPVLKGTGDGHSLFIYARSAATGEETVTTIPVTIGEAAHATSGATEMVGPSQSTEMPSPLEGPPADTSGM